MNLKEKDVDGQEAKRLAGGIPAIPNNVQKDTLYNLFLAHLLRPKEWTSQYDGNGYFAFRREHIIQLAEECQHVLSEQSMVVRADAPIKVFGDIHG